MEIESLLGKYAAIFRYFKYQEQTLINLKAKINPNIPYTLKFDGSTKFNPGPSSVGYLIT